MYYLIDLLDNLRITVNIISFVSLIILAVIIIFSLLSFMDRGTYVLKDHKKLEHYILIFYIIIFSLYIFIPSHGCIEEMRRRYHKEQTDHVAPEAQAPAL